MSQDGRLVQEWIASMRALPVERFHIPLAFSFRGDLSADALRKALNLIVERHEALRTGFPNVSRLSVTEASRAGRALTSAISSAAPVFEATVHGQVEVELPACEDAECRTSSDESVRCVAALSEMEGPFDYDAPPLVRARLVRMRREHHLLVLMFHHLVFDGWSATVFRDELVRLYRALRTNGVPRLAPLPVQYSDFAKRQRERLMRRASEVDRYSQTRFESYRLAGLTNDEVPGGCVPAPPGAGAARETVDLGGRISSAVRALCARSSTTLYGLSLAALYLLGYAYSRRTEQAVWSPFANRERLEDQALIGWVAVIRMLGTTIRPARPLQELLARTRRILIEAARKEPVPPALLELMACRMQNYRPPSDQHVQLSLDMTYSALVRPAMLPGVCMTRVHVPWALGNHVLRFEVSEGPSGIRVGCSYRTAAFGARTVRRLVEDLAASVVLFLEHPHERLDAACDLLGARGPTLAGSASL